MESTRVIWNGAVIAAPRGGAEGHSLLRETAGRQKNSGDSETGQEGGYPRER